MAQTSPEATREGARGSASRPPPEQRTTRRQFLGQSLGAVGALSATAWLESTVRSAEPAAAKPPPNLIVILTDDVGYGDLGCYGATRVRTPNLDRLATNGVRFTDAHSPSAMCSPTRYALLTGRYAWRHPPVARGVLSGVSPLCIAPGTLTLPALLKEAGYTTGAVGKWHLGLGETQTDYNAEIRPGPLDIGFDYAFVMPATGDRVPCVYVENRRVVGLDPNDPLRVGYQGKVGDEPTGRDHPEQLTLTFAQGHDGTIVNGISRIGFMAGGQAARWRDEDMADTFTKKAVAFLEQNRAKPFFLYFATHDVHVPRVPHPRFRGTSGCGVRGDAVQEMDASVGELLAALDRLGLTDNTLVVFTSDNGGVVNDGYADRSQEDLNGHSVNGPLRGFKGGLYEGGTRVPFLARWPGVIRPGTTSGELICHVDLLATAAALTARPLPAEAGPDSLNVLPALRGDAHDTPCRDHLVMHAGSGALAVRQGPWKFIPRGGKQGQDRAAAPAAAPATPAGELYHLGNDLAETKDVAAANPEVVARLNGLLATLRQDGRSRA